MEKNLVDFSGEKPNLNYSKFYIDTNIFFPPSEGKKHQKNFKCWNVNSFRRYWGLENLNRKEILRSFADYNLNYMDGLENLILSDGRINIISDVKEELREMKHCHNMRGKIIKNFKYKYFNKKAYRCFTKSFEKIYLILDYLEENEKIQNIDELKKDSTFNLFLIIAKKEKNNGVINKKNFTDELIIATALYDSFYNNTPVGILTRDCGLMAALNKSKQKISKMNYPYLNVVTFDLNYNHLFLTKYNNRYNHEYNDTHKINIQKKSD